MLKNIAIKLSVILSAPVLSCALETMPLPEEENAPNAQATQDMRYQGLARLANSGFHFGSKELMKQVPNLTKILNGLKVGNGIFFATSDDSNPILYCNRNDRIDGSMSIRYSSSIFGVRTDMIIFELASLNYWAMPSIYKEVVLSDDCWVMTKGDNILCFTYKNAGLAFNGFTDPATFITPETVKTRYAPTREMIPVLEELALILEGKAPAVYDLDLAREKLMAFNRSIKERNRRAKILSDIRAQKEEQRREEQEKEKRKLTPVSSNQRLRLRIATFFL